MPTNDLTWQQNRQKSQVTCPQCGRQGTMVYWKEGHRQKTLIGTGNKELKKIPPECSKCGYKPRRKHVKNVNKD